MRVWSISFSKHGESPPQQLVFLFVLQLAKSWIPRLQSQTLHQARSLSIPSTAAITNALQVHLLERSSTKLPTPVTPPPGTPSARGG